MKTISFTTSRILLENTYNWLDILERKKKVRNLLQNKYDTLAFAKDLEYDGNLTKKDFPKHSQKYMKAAKELRLLYK